MSRTALVLTGLVFLFAIVLLRLEVDRLTDHTLRLVRITADQEVELHNLLEACRGVGSDQATTPPRSATESAWPRRARRVRAW